MRKWSAALALVCILTLLGTAAMGEELRIEEVQRKENGDVLLSWSGGTAPYHVLYQMNGIADAHLWQEDEDGIRRLTHHTLTSLAPDTNYTLYVVDGEQHAASVELKGQPKTFSEFNIRVTMTLRQKAMGKSSTVNSFNAAKITNGLAGGDYTAGATIKLAYKLGEIRTYTYRMVMVLPDGEAVTLHSLEDKLYRSGGNAYSYWSFYDFSNFWRSVQEIYGTIPAGDYTYKLFLNDGLVHTQTIRIN